MKECYDHCNTFMLWNFVHQDIVDTSSQILDNRKNIAFVHITHFLVYFPVYFLNSACLWQGYCLAEFNITACTVKGAPSTAVQHTFTQ